VTVKQYKVNPHLRIYAARNDDNFDLSFLVININDRTHEFKLDEEPYIFDSR